MAQSRCWPGADGRDCFVPRFYHAAHERALPAPRHHCLGHQSLFRVWQFGVPRRPHRPDRHPGAVASWFGAAQRALFLLPDLDHSARQPVDDRQLTRLSTGSRRSGTQGWTGDGRGFRRRCWDAQDRRFRLRSLARVHFRLALRAFAALRESHAVRLESRYRISVHGSGRWRR